MKKLNIIMLSLSSIPVFSSNYIAIIDKEKNDYNVSESFTDRTEYTSWVVVDTICNVDLEDSDVYSDHSYTQTKNCEEQLERTATVIRTYENGHEETISKTTEKDTNDLAPTTELRTGSHYENSCNNILSFDSSLNVDGNYNIKLNNSSIVNVYCDMTTNGGGYTAFWTPSYHLTINDFYSLIESNWIRNQSSFYWKITKQDNSPEANVFTKFDNDYSHWYSNHTGGDGGNYTDKSALSPNLTASWDIKIPSINVDISRTGIVRAVPYLDLSYTATTFGLHYKRTTSGEHYPWFNSSGQMTSEGYLCLDANACDYYYGNVSGKKHMLLFK